MLKEREMSSRVDVQNSAEEKLQTADRISQDLDRVTIRFAGDSGDGMQLTGMRFTESAAQIGNDLATFPDYPAEIRAPAGSLPGVSGFQIQFSTNEVYTPGDEPDVLVAMNPAALKSNLGDLPHGGTIMVNEDAFTTNYLRLAGYDENPLDDGSLNEWRLIRVPITRLTLAAVEEVGLKKSLAERCKNFFTLGLVFFLYQRDTDQTKKWIDNKFGFNLDVARANKLALQAGYNIADTLEVFQTLYRIPKAELSPGLYRGINGNLAVSLGLVAAARKAGLDLFYGSYPITPASEILHELSGMLSDGIKTFQAEDEIAAIGATIGAAFGGALAVTGTSGPGIALKSEAMGLATMVELPLVIINVQRGGPSTGLPTKTEQADLLQVLYGRNGESPIPVLAATTPADCFNMTYEASRLALKYMTPVVLLTDGYLANGTEPWRIPNEDELPEINIKFAKSEDYQDRRFAPYERDENLSRPWAIPGTPGLEHRVGGLEKDLLMGRVSYDPDNHQQMVETRAAKIAGMAKDFPPLEVNGPDNADLLILGWGGTTGAITSAGEQLRAKGYSVADCSLRYLNPLPNDLCEVLERYEQVLIPELNLGQLKLLIRAHCLIDPIGLNKVTGKPIKIQEVVDKAITVVERPESVDEQETDKGAQP